MVRAFTIIVFLFVTPQMHDRCEGENSMFINLTCWPTGELELRHTIRFPCVNRDLEQTLCVLLTFCKSDAIHLRIIHSDTVFC